MLHLLDLQKTVLLFTSARSLCDSVHLFVCFEQNTLKSYKEILIKSLGNVDNEPKMMRFWCCSTFRRDCELWLIKYHRPMGWGCALAFLVLVYISASLCRWGCLSWQKRQCWLWMIVTIRLKRQTFSLETNKAKDKAKKQQQNIAGLCFTGKQGPQMNPKLGNRPGG